jgi:hypothetical protein
VAIELERRERVERASGGRSVEHLPSERVVGGNGHALREPFDRADAAAASRDSRQLGERRRDRADVHENFVAEGGVHACVGLSDLADVADGVLDVRDPRGARTRLRLDDQSARRVDPEDSTSVADVLDEVGKRRARPAACLEHTARARQPQPRDHRPPRRPEAVRQGVENRQNRREIGDVVQTSPAVGLTCGIGHQRSIAAGRRPETPSVPRIRQA